MNKDVGQVIIDKDKAVDEESSDDIDDKLLLEASQQYEAMNEHAQQGMGDVDSENDVVDELFLEASEQFESRFGKPATESVIDEVRNSGVPLKTRQSTDWRVKIWKDWAINRKSIPFVEKMKKNCPLGVIITKIIIVTHYFMPNVPTSSS